MKMSRDEITNFPSTPDRRPGQAQEKPDQKEIDDIERRKQEQIERSNERSERFD
jgi:hypothetical protein